MKRLCKGYGCQEQRIHHERPEEPRGPQYVEVPDDYPLDQPVFCSLTCQMLSKKSSSEGV